MVSLRYIDTVQTVYIDIALRGGYVLGTYQRPYGPGCGVRCPVYIMGRKGRPHVSGGRGLSNMRSLNRQYDCWHTPKYTRVKKAAVASRVAGFADDAAEVEYVLQSIESSTIDGIWLLGHTAGAKFVRSTVLLGLSLRSAQSSQSVLFACMQYAESLASPEVVEVATAAFEDLMASHTPQAGESTWHDQIKMVLAKWDALKNSKASQMIQRFVAILVAWGFASVLGFKVDKAKWDKLYNAGGTGFLWGADIVSTVVKVLSYVYDNFQQFVATRDPWCLLGMSKEAQDRDVEYAYLVANAPVVERGSCVRELDISETAFELRLMDAITAAQNYVTLCESDSAMRVHATSKLVQLQRVQAKLRSRWKTKAMREAPYAISLSGAAGLGKTAITPMIVKAMFHGAGEVYDPRFITSINANDAYDQADNLSRVLILDDVGQTNPTYVERAPTAKIIEIINNDNAPMVKADLPDKGCVFWNAFGVVATSNDPMLCAGVYSMWPTAVLRRFKYHITVEVKPEFGIENPLGGPLMLDPTKATAVVADMWMFTFKVAVPKDTGATCELIPHVHKFRDGSLASGHTVGLDETLRIISDATTSHRASQVKYVGHIDALNAESMCAHGSFPQICSLCPTPVVGVQSTAQSVAKALGVTYWSAFSLFFSVYILDTALARWSRTTSVRSAVLYNCAMWLFQPVATTMLFQLVFPSWGLYCSVISLVAELMYFVASLVAFTRHWKGACAHYAVILASRSTSFRDKALKCVSGLAVAYGVLKVYQFLNPPDKVKYGDALCAQTKETLDPQGSLMSLASNVGTTVPEPDEDVRVDVWAKKVYVPWSQPDPKMRTTSLEHVAAKVRRQLGTCKLTSSANDKVSYCNMLMVRTNVGLVTNHSLQWMSLQGGMPDRAVVMFHEEDGCGPMMDISLSPANVHRIGQTDLALVYTGTGGDRQDLVDLFAVEVPKRSGVVHEFFRTKGDRTVTRLSFSVDCRKTKDQTGTYESTHYDRPQATFDGLCGAVHVMESVTPCILSIHNAGVDGQQPGRGCVLTRDMLVAGIDKLFVKSVVFRPGTATECVGLNTQSTAFAVVPHMHAKSPLRGLDNSSPLIAMGSHNGPRRVSKSALRSTGISSVLLSAGVPCTHGLPPFHLARELKARTLIEMSSPCRIPIDDLLLAAQDWNDHCVGFLNANPKLKTIVKPLNMTVAISGRDGMQGVDKIDMSTSAGWPFNCPKRELFERIEPTEWCSEPYKIKDEYVHHVVHLEEMYAAGKRAYVPFSCCFKDEPVKIGKDKLRVFSGINWALGLLVRRYFLPIIRLSLLYPTVFESAVGVNAAGPEWAVLVEHACKKGRKRCEYGDYQKYDKMISDMLSGCQWQVWINMARVCGYTLVQLTIMQGIASEVTNPVYEWDGDFFMPNGTNPSGNNVTVQLNGGVGSMLKRSAFYSLARQYELAPPSEGGDGGLSYPRVWKDVMSTRLSRVDVSFEDRLNAKPLMRGLQGRFRKYVSLLTYGDDNASSCSVEVPWYNQITISEYFARCGITYTDASKSKFEREYEEYTSFNFLKRGASWNSDTESLMAPLDVGSIYKSLHLRKYNPDITDAEHDAGRLSDALREFLAHGREVYDTHRVLFTNVASSVGIMSHVRGARFLTYDEQVVVWRQGNELIQSADDLGQRSSRC